MGNMAQMVAKGALANGTYSGDRAGLERFAGLPSSAPALAPASTPSRPASTMAPLAPAQSAQEGTPDVGADDEDRTRRKNLRVRPSLILGNEETLGG